MKRLLILSLIFAANVACAAPNWTPDAATISRLESNIKPGDIPRSGPSTQYPSGHSPLIAEYARYYVGYTAHGRRMIRGELVIPATPGDTVILSGSKMKPVGIYVVGSEKDLPDILDGGCAVVHVIYAVETAHIVSLKCNGYA
jgi:hypothetical protein